MQAAHPHHDHAHPAPPAGGHNAAFAIGVGLNLAFVAAEVAFGFLAHSLTLLADAGHNLSDVLGLAVAWAAAAVASKRPSARYTYGLRRASILAALANALLLLVAVGAIAVEAIRRFAEPANAASATIMWVAGAGVLVNGATALLFLRGRENDLNVQGAFLHMAADAGVSVGVVVAGGLIALTGRAWIDPVTSLLIALVILVSTWRLLRGSVSMSLDAAPSHIDLGAVDAFLRGLPGVTAIHDLHVWPLSTTQVALTAHLVCPRADAHDALLREASEGLRERFGIDHTTIQIEREEMPHGPDDRGGASRSSSVER